VNELNRGHAATVSKPYSRRDRLKLRLGHLGTVVLVMFLALALAGLLAPTFGWRLDVVQSGSMEPAIGVGALVVTAPERPENVKAGDVISFWGEGRALICHRVVEVDDQAFITKGDANVDNDPSAVPFNDLEGRVAFSVPLLGYVIEFLKSPFGWALIILLAVLVIVVGSGKKESAGEGGR
jgi:signal peptidase